LIALLVAKRFSRRGFIIVTSDLMGALIEGGTSRELMMLIGRQLGHIKPGTSNTGSSRMSSGHFTC
jgi:hypothetical protein